MRFTDPLYSVCQQLRQRRVLSKLLASALTLQLIISCGSSTSHCVPGQSIACSGTGCTGHQVCAANGESYEQCVCDNGSAGQFPATGPNSGLIGAACTDASGCRTGLECITSHSTYLDGEGPSSGMCLAQCVPGHDFCKGLDATSQCIVLDNGGPPANTGIIIAYCLPGCQLGTQPNEADKCRGRSDLVCSESPAGSGSGFCRPVCRSDVDCDGRFCDLSTGLCGDAARTGDPIGAVCSATTVLSTSCAGGCLPITTSYAECSGVCSYDTPGCGQTNSTTKLAYYCYIDPTNGSGAGDLGYCAKLCDCDSDCGRTDAVCEPVSTITSTTGRGGVCGSKTLPSGASRANHPC
jgi:hypothetical protein